MASSAVDGAGVAVGEQAPEQEQEQAQAPRRVIPLQWSAWLAKPGVEPLLVTILFVVLTVVMTWPWTLHMGQAINPFGDVIVQMTTLQWNAHALTTNPTGLFEAPFFYPYRHSLAFSENLLGETLLTLPILLLTGNPALASNFYILLTFVLTGLFTYLLVRDLTGSRLAGVFAGVAFAFCPFRFMQMGHLHMLSTQWFPFTLWALRRGLGVLDYGHWTSRYGAIQQKSIVRHPRATLWLILAALGFVMMGLSSVYYTYFLAIAVLIYLVWWGIVEFREASKVADVKWGPVGLGAFISVLLVVLVLGPVFWPYLQLNQDLGFARTTYEVQNWGASWSYYRNVLSSNWLYGQVLAPSWVSHVGERQLFPGIVASVLALVGLVFGRGRERWFYPILGLTAFVLTFGLSHNLPGTSREVPLPYALLYDWVPGFKALRVPVRFAVLVDFSLYVLAGYGLARILQLLRRTEKVEQPQSPSVLEDNLGYIVLDTQKLQPIEPEVVEVVVKPNRRRTFAVAGVLTFLVLLEFLNPLDTDNRRDVAAQLETIEPYGWLARPENAGPVLELPMSADQPDVWYTFFGTKHWQPLVNGWSSFVPPGTMQLKLALDAFPDARTVSMLQGLEVRHVVVHLWQYPEDQQAGLKQRLDATPQLKMVNQAGDNYVYELAANPWLREIAEDVLARDAYIWVGEAKSGSMPGFEVLAYALNLFGVPKDHIGGNINIGHRHIGSLPFGTQPDYVLTPNLEGDQDIPFGFEYMQEIPRTESVRFLQSPPGIIKIYDMTQRNAPNTDLDNLRMGVSTTGVNFGDSPNRDAEQGGVVLNMTFLSFTPARIDVQLGSSKVVSVTLPVGISRLATRPFSAPRELNIEQRSGDATLLKVDLLKASGAAPEGPDAFLLPPTEPVPVPIEVTTSRDGDFLDVRMRVVTPEGGDEFAATLDVYSEPWGTHPEGHFGYWSVVIPADGEDHDYNLRLDPLLKTVTATRDGAGVEAFAWQGPPNQGDFRATLHITRKGSLVATVPLYLFTVAEGRLASWYAEPAHLTVVRP
ncbi:MAG: hypothetical protein M3437_12815 [Chloroflexota bacterium]|nr:hypothetical protein [Chloroflexota bacterium]MDQ5866299.1 hypothetical protein [Chloroflexota bacterium]